jgi:p-cumate 2,3-dioxygenase alpha subunit
MFGSDIASLIDDRAADGVFRVNRLAMTSAEIFALEQDRIFAHTWLYLGHDEEIPNPGDYQRRIVGGKPLFFVRGKDGVVRAFFNTCTHRGAQVCRRDQGHATGFTCFYHGWTFSTEGTLVGVPEEDAYTSGFRREDLALGTPARLDSYRGLYFVSFDPDIESLTSYLGAACRLIDQTVDSATLLGGWSILRGSAKYAIRANWKLLIENSYDGYHLAPVHQTYLEYIAWRRELKGNPGKRPLQPSRGFALRNGHGGILHRAQGRGIASPSPVWSDATNAEVERIKAAAVAQFGEARGRAMCEYSRHMLIFPNLAFQDSQSGFRLRQMNPVAPDLVDVQQWEFVPRNEDRELRESRMENSLAFLGPGGLATPDDVEALESCQLGFAGGGVKWSDISRGTGREATMNDELQMRAFWRGWRARMSGTIAENTDDPGRCSGDAIDVLEVEKA